MRSPIKWFGGKSLLAQRIVDRIPPHVCYVEVFGGAGWVLFRKERSKSEVYNDLNGDLVNLFEVLRDRQEEFARKAEFLIPNRTDFYRARNEPREHLDLVDRALRFYTLIHYSFNANLRQYMPIATRAPAAVNLDLLREAGKRLQKVWIERLDFEELIRKYDRPDTFFYLDPPYAELPFASGVYGWKDSEHDRLKRALAGVQGRFLMSYPDWPRFRTLWQDHRIEAIPTRYKSFRRDAQHRYVDELLISNYEALASPLLRPAHQETVVNADDVLAEP